MLSVRQAPNITSWNKVNSRRSSARPAQAQEIKILNMTSSCSASGLLADNVVDLRHPGQEIKTKTDTAHQAHRPPTSVYKWLRNWRYAWRPEKSGAITGYRTTREPPTQRTSRLGRSEKITPNPSIRHALPPPPRLLSRGKENWQSVR